MGGLFLTIFGFLGAMGLTKLLKKPSETIIKEVPLPYDASMGPVIKWNKSYRESDGTIITKGIDQNGKGYTIAVPESEHPEATEHHKKLIINRWAETNT